MKRVLGRSRLVFRCHRLRLTQIEEREREREREKERERERDNQKSPNAVQI